MIAHETTAQTETTMLNWIGGEWVGSDTIAESINPATYEVIGTYADGGLYAAKACIAAAKKAFAQTPWKRDRMLRAKVLNQLADAYECHRDELIELVATENGKIKPEAAFEVYMVPNKLRYAASVVRTDYGRAMEPKPGSLSIVIREAIGVAGVIVPWNSPVVLMIRSLAPALTAGCTAVIKMPHQSAQVGGLTAKIMAEAPDLPPGVINLYNESTSTGSRHIIDSPDVPTISFTGSTNTGRSISASGAQNLKRFGLELGGKTPMILFDDADLDVAIPKVQQALTVFAGQFCMTGSRLLVQRGIADEVRQRLATRLRDLIVGPASDPGSEMGPIIDKPNVARIDKMVEEAIAAGAQVIVRGGPVTEGPLAAGAFYRPTLLEVTDASLEIVQKEVFGPVITLQVFDTEAEAVALANDSEYGLCASIWTLDLNRSMRVAREVEAGTIWFNDWAVIYDEFEEGGYKQSGIHRMNGLAALDDFLEYKHITFSPGMIAA